MFTWDKNPGETAPGGVNLRLTKSKKPAKLLLAVIFDPGPDQYSPKALLLCKNFSSPTPRVRDAIFFLPRLSLVRAFAARCGSCFCCLIQLLTPFGTESFFGTPRRCVLLLPAAVADTIWNGELFWYAEALRSKWCQQPPARSTAYSCFIVLDISTITK
ncbi:MAG: hypothetical protein BWX52_00918 [Bacteroidetes bacterium ADurb.Bin013]|nr:MAG: hypothetical protein BWX52_00918 [Bacteroidetes bacterium ADurb.Bin013]